jgi:hypothetical protein
MKDILKQKGIKYNLNKKYIYKVLKALYSLKQSPRL